MNIHSQKRILSFAAASLTAGILFAAARIFISLPDLEPGIEMYAHGSVSAVLLHAALTVGFLLTMLAGIAVVRKNEKNAESFPARTIFSPSPLNVFTSTLCGFMLLAFSLMVLFHLYADRWAPLAPLFGGRQTHASGAVATAVFTLLLTVLAVPSAIYFFKAAAGTPKNPTAYGFFSTIPVLWLVILLLGSYFDAATAFNSPVKIVRLLSVAVMMLYAVQESRMVLGIPMPRLYFSFAYTAVFFGTVQVISDLVLYSCGKIVMQNGYLGLAIEASYILYIFSRLLGFGLSAKKESVRVQESAS